MIKRSASIWSIAVVLAFISLHSALAVDLPFCDDFETHTLGAAPAAPWVRAYNQNSIIVSPGFPSSGQCVKLRGAWNWSDTLYVQTPTIDTFDRFTFKIAFKVGNGGAGAGQYQFSGAMVNDRNILGFSPDANKIAFSTLTGGGSVTIVPYCQTDTWYFGEVTISGFLTSNATADVKVFDQDGVLLGAQSGIVADNASVVGQKRFVLHTRSQPLNGQGAIAYFDDVCIIGLSKIGAAVDIDPDTLNLDSKGKWITCYIGLPEGYDVHDIDVKSILLEDLLEVEHSDIQGDVLMVKFNRQELIEYLDGTSGDVNLTVTGELTDGTPFEGGDTIRVIEKD